MTPDEAKAAVGGYAVARYANGSGPHGWGRVVSYSMVPTLTIETEDGTQFSWRHDLCDAMTEAEATVARFDAYSQEQHREGVAEARDRIAERRSERTLRSNLEVIRHELETPMRGHDTDGSCCLRASLGGAQMGSSTDAADTTRPYLSDNDQQGETT